MTDDPHSREQAEARLQWTMRLAGVEAGQQPWPAFRRVWRRLSTGEHVLRRGARWRPPSGGLF
jgi:hypothetical protein